MSSATDHESALLEKIHREVEAGRMSGPFLSPPMPNLYISPMGVVPCKSRWWVADKYSLILPPSLSINDHIDPAFTTVTYTSFDTVIQTISHLGPGALLAKSDIKNAFQLLPINPADFELLGIHIKGEYYIDKCLPFGCSISCKIFETFSTFLEWAVRFKSNFHTVHHYLDDFIFAGHHNSNHCQIFLRSFQELCSELGVTLNPDKTIKSTTLLTFSGLDIDKVNMQIKISVNKVPELKALLNTGVTRKKLRLSYLDTLVGRLR
jgi:hypothetical protein